MSKNLRQVIEWLPAEDIKLLPQWHSSAMEYVPLLLSLEGHFRPVIGRYLGGLIQQWRIDGSPTEFHPEYWAPMPDNP